MPYPCLGNQHRLVSRFHNAVGEVDIFTETHLGESPKLLIHLPLDAHVERTGVELVKLLLASTNAARCKEAGHGIADGLLDRCERRVGSVRTAEGSKRLTPLPLPHREGSGYLSIYGLQVVFGENHIAVQDDEPFAFCPFGSVVTTLTGAAVLFGVIMQIKDACVFVANILAGFYRSVFNNQYLKVLDGLSTKTLKQLIHLIGTVKDGNDD